ncbi:gliding motility-associated C-terminal domain-containing protein [Pontibacter sp. Tf4]|uniref:Ig-like domain-containing protein n=1 Tax=Pontibacter sp. Tf4 TaxID=2761620 RepID=UPI00162A040E|nr:Ig-like domain-containing protein [Pontibacter sp. Tf4]MBB6610721.1 gliding motility-associated C-terminal domain-containing protein [Pontibacter sp. Tf4]
MAHPYPFRWQYLLLLLCLLSAVTVSASPGANKVGITRNSPLETPQLTAAPGVAGSIYLTWSNVNATQYIIEYAKLPGAAFTTLATVGGTTTGFHHGNLGYSETLQYRIKATGSGQTVYSNTVTATTHPANYSYRIMPLGDSNTDGGSGSIDRADRVGYRNTLYRLLRSAGFTIDMVGSEVSGTNTVTAFKQQFGYAPDLDHAGFGGAKITDITTLLKNGKNNSGTPYLDQYKPDIILLHIGTNSLGYDQNITELESILKEVDAYEARAKREVTVVLAQIIKQCTDCGANAEDMQWDIQNTATYNQRMKEMATRRQAAGDRLVLVDMANGAGLNYSRLADMHDYLHPNSSGYDKMAQVWFGALKSMLTPTDTHAPETQITANPPAITNSRTATFSFTSNEAGVTYQASIDDGAFATVSNPVTLQNLTDGKHTIRVRATDGSGNTDQSPAAYTWTIDATPPPAPAIVAVSEDLGPVANDRITSDNKLLLKGTAEPEADITISRTGTGVIGTSKAGTDGKWEFSYEQTALPEGTHTFTATAADALDNKSGAGENFTVTIDRTSPTATLATTATSPVNKAFQVQISFSEAIYSLQASGFIVTNGTISNLQSQNERTYTATLTPTTDGAVTLQLQAGKATDLAGNTNTASNTLQLTADITRPTIAISSTTPELLNTGFAVTIKFSEAVTGFEQADIQTTNGTITSFSKADASNYTAQVTPTGQGKVTVSIASDMASDAASNGNEPSNTLSRTFDSVAPSGYAVAFDVQQVNVNNEHSVNVKVTGAESGANYNYTITSNNGGNAVTGTGTATGNIVAISGLDLSGLKDGTLTVSLYLTDKAGNQGEPVTAQVAKITREIASVTPSGHITVPFDTDFSALELPQKAKVTYTTGEEDFLNVTWQPGNYNRKVAGTYTLAGNLALAENTTNFGNKKASIQVTVEPNLPPTELNISATEFKPDAEPTDVLASFTTQDPEDEVFTYELVSGEGDAHNSFFRVQDAQLYLVSNKGLSGKKEFTIRVRTTDPYQNSLERTFTLTKLPFDPDRIKLVNAFSPDGDGINETWTVPELRFYDQVEITVLDRSGTRLFHSTDPEKGWDGKGRNGNVQEGPYFYIIRILDIDLVQKGVVTVLK